MELILNKYHELKNNGCNRIGFEEENKAESLDILVEDESLLSKDPYIEFQVNENKKYSTLKLEYVEGHIIYPIPNTLLYEKGYLRVQVVIRGENNYVWRSTITSLIIDESIIASTSVLDPHDDLMASLAELEEDYYPFKNYVLEQLSQVDTRYDTFVYDTVEDFHKAVEYGLNDSQKYELYSITYDGEKIPQQKIKLGASIYIKDKNASDYWLSSYTSSEDNWLSFFDEDTQSNVSLGTSEETNVANVATTIESQGTQYAVGYKIVNVYFNGSNFTCSAEDLNIVKTQPQRTILKFKDYYYACSLIGSNTYLYINTETSATRSDHNQIQSLTFNIASNDFTYSHFELSQETIEQNTNDSSTKLIANLKGSGLDGQVGVIVIRGSFDNVTEPTVYKNFTQEELNIFKKYPDRIFLWDVSEEYMHFIYDYYQDDHGNYVNLRYCRYSISGSNSNINAYQRIINLDFNWETNVVTYRITYQTAELDLNYTPSNYTPTNLLSNLQMNDKTYEVGMITIPFLSDTDIGQIGDKEEYTNFTAEQKALLQKYPQRCELYDEVINTTLRFNEGLQDSNGLYTKLRFKSVEAKFENGQYYSFCFDLTLTFENNKVYINDGFPMNRLVIDNQNAYNYFITIGNDENTTPIGLIYYSISLSYQWDSTYKKFTENYVDRTLYSYIQNYRQKLCIVDDVMGLYFYFSDDSNFTYTAIRDGILYTLNYELGSDNKTITFTVTRELIEERIIDISTAGGTFTDEQFELIMFGGSNVRLKDENDKIYNYNYGNADIILYFYSTNRDFSTIDIYPSNKRYIYRENNYITFSNSDEIPYSYVETSKTGDDKDYDTLPGTKVIDIAGKTALTKDEMQIIALQEIGSTKTHPERVWLKNGNEFYHFAHGNTSSGSYTFIRNAVYSDGSFMYINIDKQTDGTGKITTDEIPILLTDDIGVQVAPLDSNKKIPFENIPDTILHQLVYGGTVGLGTDNQITAVLSNDGKAKLNVQVNQIILKNEAYPTSGYGYTQCQGLYLVTSTAFIFAGEVFQVGDWLVATASTWKKIQNVDAVVSVNGKIGAVEIAKGDIELGNVDNTSDLNKPISKAAQAALDGKVDKESGKGLSSNDFTDAEKEKLKGIAEGANKTVVDSTLSTTSTNPVQNKVINTALSGKANTTHTHKIADVTNLQTTLDGKASTDPATQSANGLMSKEDKTKLDGISENATEIRLSDMEDNLRNMATDLGNKVDAVDGKGLSTNDYTTAEKTKLEGIAPNATAVIVDRLLDKDSDNAISNKAVTNNINTLTGNINNLQTAVNELQAGSAESLNSIKINNVEVSKQNKASNIETDEVSILYDDSKLHLPNTWIAYLQKQTFAAPTITLGGISSRNVEWGANVSVAANTITHRETNIDNIKANTLKLYRNNVSVVDLTPNTAATNIDYAIDEAITNNVSFIIKCTDTMNNTRQSSTITYSAYKPCYYGALDAASITSVDGLTKKASSSLGTVTFTSTEGQYGYLVTAGNINSVISGGFPVPGELMQDITVTLNGLSVTYHVWRCSSSIAAGSNTWTVA